MLEPTIELSDPANQLVSTLNTSGSLFLVKQRTSVKTVHKLIRELLLDVKPIRTYMGVPIGIEYLTSANHWVDMELANALLEKIASLGIDVEELGYEAYIGSTSFKHAIVFTLIKMFGLQNSVKRAQYFVNFYNRSKSIKCHFNTSTELSIEFTYALGVQHTSLSTLQNLGLLKAIWSTFGYENFQLKVVSDRFGTEAEQGHTCYIASWTEHSLWYRLQQRLKQKLITWLTDDTIYGSLLRMDHKNPLFAGYVDEYEEKIAGLKRLEQHYIATISAQDQQIEAQQRELRQLKNRLVDKFERWIEQHYGDSDATIEKAVDDIGTTVSTLNRRLKERGMPTSKRLLNEYRLNTAKELLQTQKPSEVFLACGFKTASHFSRSYKAQFGAPPSQEHTSSDANNQATTELNQ